MSEAVIDFGAPAELEGTCPRCGKSKRPIYARRDVRRCCECWAAAAAAGRQPVAVRFGTPARGDGGRP